MLRPHALEEIGSGLGTTQPATLDWPETARRPISPVGTPALFVGRLDSSCTSSGDSGGLVGLLAMERSGWMLVNFSSFCSVLLRLSGRPYRPGGFSAAGQRAKTERYSEKRPVATRASLAPNITVNF